MLITAICHKQLISGLICAIPVHKAFYVRDDLLLIIQIVTLFRVGDGHTAAIAILQHEARDQPWTECRGPCVHHGYR